jgi:methionine aminotransferase
LFFRILKSYALIIKEKMISIKDKLPQVGTTIFTVMSQLAHQHQAINLAQGFPNFDMPQRLKDLVNEFVQKGYNQYAPMTGVPALNRALSAKIADLYDAEVEALSEITVTAGATQAIYTAITAFVSLGDEVILIEPAYDSYRPGIELAGGVPVVYELAAPDFKVNWEDFARLISDRTQLIIINTPHNPTATTFDAADWEALEAMVKGTNILILSDEVYEHITFDDEPHQSILRYPNLWERTIAAYSFGKTFSNTGWKVGYVVAPSYLMKVFRKVHQYNVFSVHAPSQFALAEFLKNKETYLGLGKFYQEKRDLFQELTQDSLFKFFPSKGSYFQLADYSAISDENDMNFAVKMTKEYKVSVIPVSAFYSSKRDDKLIRFCFAKTDDILEASGEILRKIG